MTCRSNLPPRARRTTGRVPALTPVAGLQRRRGNPPLHLLRWAAVWPFLVRNAAELIAWTIIATGIAVAFIAGDPT